MTTSQRDALRAALAKAAPDVRFVYVPIIALEPLLARLDTAERLLGEAVTMLAEQREPNDGPAVVNLCSRASTFLAAKE